MKPLFFVIQEELLTFRIVSLYIRFKAPTSLKEENSKVISPKEIIQKTICLLIHFHFDVTCINSSSKNSGDDETQVNVGHFAKSFMFLFVSLNRT